MSPIDPNVTVAVEYKYHYYVNQTTLNSSITWASFPQARVLEYEKLGYFHVDVRYQIAVYLRTLQ